MGADCNTNKVKELNELTKRSIIEAFLALLKEKDFKKISISSIVEKAGVARVSFYRNFNSKEDILYAHLHELINIESNYNGEFLARDKLREILIRQFTICYENREFLKILERNSLLYLLYEIIQEKTVSSIQKIHYYQNEIQAPYFAGASFGVIHYWISTDFSIPIDQLVDDFIACSYFYYHEKRG